MSCNVHCVPVSSRWVRQFILTADCELAVWFKNGVCCLYPHTTQAWFNQAIAAAGPGQYVHQALYKKMPYRLIRPPCPPIGGITTPCCPNALPTTLHATFNLAPGSTPLHYDGARHWTSLDVAMSCGLSIRYRLQCTSAGPNVFLTLEGSCNAGTSWWGFQTTGGGYTCAPLNATFSVPIPQLFGCGACEGQTINAIVTL
jgi:hypothetical protein